MPYLTAGDPSLVLTPALVRAAVDAGADLIELGVPFSDPMADGPVLQRAAARAIAGGTSLPRVLETVAELRRDLATPIVLFGYYNPFFRYGVDAIARDAATVGVDGLLCVDLPPEEAGELRAALRAAGLDLIALLAPTTPTARVRRIARVRRGLSLLRVGPGRDGRPRDPPRGAASAGRGRCAQVTDLPIGVGFGVQTPDAGGLGRGLRRRRGRGERAGACHRGVAARGRAGAGRRVRRQPRRRHACRRPLVATYDDTIAWLQRLEVSGGWDLKLERMHAALAIRGNPERAFPSVHLAGTNGKGSTAAMVEAVLRAAGGRTGLYTSPHLVDFAERVRAGGRTIPHDAVVDLVAELRAAVEPRGIALTHFEFSTLLALEWFARIGVELAVVEVGLGGRLDATNTVRPVVTAITSIAHDHEEWLGRELRQIAFEKAGIAKPGVPLVVGRVPAEADAVIAAHAADVGSPRGAGRT